MGLFKVGKLFNSPFKTAKTPLYRVQSNTQCPDVPAKGKHPMSIEVTSHWVKNVKIQTMTLELSSHNVLQLNACNATPVGY